METKIVTNILAFFFFFFFDAQKLIHASSTLPDFLWRTTHPSSLQSDVAALIAFKANICTGEPLIEWGINLSSPCGWEGVHCSHGLRVSSLHLPSRNLSGSISPHLAFLPHLTYLNLSMNNFHGGIPAELALLAPTLTHLDLRRNSLAGHIPPELGLCKELLCLDLSNNTLRGSIPSSLANLRNLQTLRLHNLAYLTGAIPPELGNLEKLVEMDLINNHLTGPIPAELGHLRNLQLLSVSMNSFSGGIPPELGQLSNLTHFYARSCNLSGPLLPHLGNLSNLRVLSLESNHFTAAIPAELGRLKNLCELILYVNTLGGEIPSTLANLTALRIIDASGNSITGELPDFPRNFTQLEYINMANNHLSGNIGSKLSSMSNVRYIYLSNNALTGSIPASFANYSSLHTLDLSRNQFTGSLPDSLALCENLRSLLLGDNQLGGPLPSWLWSLSQLEVLDLSDNFFTGTIPNSLHNLHGLQDMLSLQSLNLSHNLLTGEIPSVLNNLPFLTYVNFSSNNFSGNIPLGGWLCNFSTQSFPHNPNLRHLSSNSYGMDENPNLKNFTMDGKGGPNKFQRCFSTVLEIAVGVVWFVALINVAFWWVRRRKPVQNDHTQPVLRGELNVTVQDLIRATDGYNDSNIIGKGGFSTVYKAVLANGTVVAIKKLNTLINEEVAWRSLVAECKTLGKIRHRNLVKILCTCVTAHLRAILLEYMPNGSLHTLLYQTQVCSLNWKTRFKIACGIAEGLKYLHYDSGFGQILHLDLKPGNILLDKDFEPHITDFGISRIVNRGKDGATLASTFGGSIGYMAPEMGYSNRVTSKADVYCYGVIILELITRKRPTDTPLDWTNYPGWIHSFLPNNTMEVIDPQLHDDATLTQEGYQEILCLLNLGLMCARVLPSNRPTMIDILKMLYSIPGNGAIYPLVASD